jgi:hypothetical protein
VAGKDATELFLAVGHSVTAHDSASKYIIGRVRNGNRSNQLLKVDAKPGTPSLLCLSFVPTFLNYRVLCLVHLRPNLLFALRTYVPIRYRNYRCATKPVRHWLEDVAPERLFLLLRVVGGRLVLVHFSSAKITSKQNEFLWKSVQRIASIRVEGFELVYNSCSFIYTIHLLFSNSKAIVFGDCGVTSLQHPLVCSPLGARKQSGRV